MKNPIITFIHIFIGANSTEMDPDTLHPVVIDMPEHNGGDMGGTMRLGKRRTIFKNESLLSEFSI